MDILPKNRRLLFVIADIILIALSIYFAFFLRFDGAIPSNYFNEGVIKETIILTAVFCVAVFYFSGLYSFSWAYVSTTELVSLFKAVTISFLLLLLSFFALKSFEGFPRSTFVISYFLIFIFCGLTRFAFRIYLQIFNPEKRLNGERTLIVGAGDAGEQILRSILSLKNSHYMPVGFIDDNTSKVGRTIHGIEVMGTINDIPLVASRNKIKAMIIALPSAGSRTIKRAVEAGRKAELNKIKIVPVMEELISGDVSLKDIREVQVEDLLGREEIKLDTNAIENFIKGRRVLITGAAGSIGSELSRQVSKFRPSSVMLLDQDETGIFNISNEIGDKIPDLELNSVVADVCDTDNIKNIFNNFKPQIVFHAAAYKHVHLMEKQPKEAVKNNVFGTKSVAEAAIASNAEKFVFISTDKAVNPVSIMGITKRIGEMICQNLNGKTKFVSVRFGNVLNSRGSVIPIFKDKIKRGEQIEVTHPDMKRYFMMISEAVLLVMQAAEMGNGGEVFVLDMGKPVKIIDLAKDVIKYSGFEPDKDIPIVFSKPRPGEKLFEEILTAEEGTMATKNQKIFVAKFSQNNNEDISQKIEELKSPKEDLSQLLKKIVRQI